MDIIGMQNWKKQIISDPLLNCLLLPTLDSQQILNNHILTLSQTQVVNVYTRLASLKHALTKSIQKEVEHRHEKLEQSFQETYHLQKNYSLANQTALFTQMRQLEKFNEKYETVEETLPTYLNACKLIHYAKALERFRVNVRLLKTLMKDTHVINAVKTSKIIKQLTTLSLKYDFTGLQTYETERAFLNSSRETLQQIVGKELTTLLALTSEEEEVVLGKIQVLQNLNKLKEFLTTFYKNMAKEAGQCLKKAFTIPSQVDMQSVPSLFHEYSKQVICGRLHGMSCTLLYLQELLFKNNVNVTMPNLFEKFWEKIIQFLGDLIKWNVEQESKDNSTKSLLSLVEAKSEGKLDSRYLHSTVWKYPSLFSAVTNLVNQVHLYIAEKVHYYDYDFSVRKEDLIFVLLPLSLLYYRSIHNFVEQISSKMICVGWKNGERLRMFVDLVQWLLSCVEVKEIYEKVVWECIEVLEALKKQPMEAQGRREFKLLCKNIKHALKKKEEFLFQGNKEIEQIVCKFKALETFHDK